MMALMHPEDPQWRDKAEERRRMFMKSWMRERRWPNNLGPAHPLAQLVATERSLTSTPRSP
jgi:hypothetical protein